VQSEPGSNSPVYNFNWCMTKVMLEPSKRLNLDALYGLAFATPWSTHTSYLQIVKDQQLTFCLCYPALRPSCCEEAYYRHSIQNVNKFFKLFSPSRTAYIGSLINLASVVLRGDVF